MNRGLSMGGGRALQALPCEESFVLKEKANAHSIWCLLLAG
jgi:hypothetical protein